MDSVRVVAERWDVVSGEFVSDSFEDAHYSHKFALEVLKDSVSCSSVGGYEKVLVCVGVLFVYEYCN